MPPTLPIQKRPHHISRRELLIAAGAAAAASYLLTGPSLAATNGVTIQGSPVGTDGSFTPGLPYALPISGETVTAYLNPASAALITVN